VGRPLESLVTKGVAGPGFKISFEIDCSLFVPEGDIGSQLPRPMVARTFILAAVVVFYPRPQVFGKSYIAACRRIHRFQDVDIEHHLAPMCAGWKMRPAKGISITEPGSTSGVKSV
jgi:hypothetical protein